MPIMLADLFTDVSVIAATLGFGVYTAATQFSYILGFGPIY